MSYILDALQKAERERALGRTPDLSTVHAPPPRNRPQAWPWLLGLGLLANAAVVAALWLWPQMPSPATGQPQALETAAAPVVSATQPTTPPKAAATPSPPPVAALAPTARTAPLEHPVPISRKPLPPPPPPPPLVTTTPKTLPPTATRPSKPTPPPEAPRNTLPPLNVDAHVYADDPSRRFVLINLRRYREGERLEEGPLLQAITQEGVVLRFKKQRIVLPVHP